MGRPRIVRKAEEAAAIPPEQAIQVEIPPEGTVEVKPDIKPDIQADKKPESAPKVEEKQDDEVTTLKAQLADMQKAAEESRKMAEEAARREAEARKQYVERDKEFRSVSTRADQAEYDAVLNAISAATAEAEQATQELQVAGEAQDWSSIAKAQSKLSRANTRLVQLEDGKIALEARAERIKNEPKEQVRIHSGDQVADYIDSMPSLLPSQKDWLKQHRDLMTDNKKNIRLQNAHIDAEEAGHSAGTTQYFQFLEERLGYRKPISTKTDEDGADDTDDTKPVIVAAPVSRETPSAATGRPQSATRITLTPAQREAARSAGIDEIEYAKQLIRLQEAKKEGRYEH